MKELDVLLGRWVEARYALASGAEQALFQQFIELPDPEMARYLLGRVTPADPALRELVAGVLGIPAPAA
jgi:succinate dehydrogenase flavin-adding protein (antitoxin of CptAB toxin-antitoxin module)